MIRCREVAKLLTSDQLEFEGLMRRAWVTIHLLACGHCSRLLKQIQQIRSAAQNLAVQIDREHTGEGRERLEGRLMRNLSGKKR